MRCGWSRLRKMCLQQTKQIPSWQRWMADNNKGISSTKWNHWMGFQTTDESVESFAKYKHCQAYITENKYCVIPVKLPWYEHNTTSVLILQHWFRWWFAAIRRRTITWTNVDHVLWGVSRPRWVNACHLGRDTVAPTRQLTCFVAHWGPAGVCGVYCW